MKQATYHTPDREPRVYDCKDGAERGTVDLLNSTGRVIISGLRVLPAEAPLSSKSYAVLIKDRTPSRPAVPAKAPAPVEAAASVD